MLRNNHTVIEVVITPNFKTLVRSFIAFKRFIAVEGIEKKNSRTFNLGIEL